MTHEEASALLLDLAYGELPPGAAREVSQHAAGCADCTGELARIAAVRAVAARSDERSPGRASREALVRAARRRASSPRLRRWLDRPPAASFAAAAMVVAIVAGVTVKLTQDRRAGAGDGPRGIGESVATSAPEPARTEERREVQSKPVAATPTIARPPAPTTSARTTAPRPPATPPASAGAAAAPPRRASADGTPQASAAPAAEPVESSPRNLAQQKRAASGVAAPSTPGAAPPSHRGGEGRDPPGGLVPGGLVEERRQLRCGELLVDRLALVARGGRIVKLTERRGGAVAEGWYDDSGRLRDPGTRNHAARGTPELPPTAPTLEALGTACAW